jgi:integrase
MLLAWQPSTLQRYEALLREFEEVHGSITTMGNEKLIEKLLDHAATLTRTGSASRALTAVAAVAWAAKLRRGFDPYKDPRIGAMRKAIDIARKVTTPPKPKRDPLPVAAVVAFAGRCPIGWSYWRFVVTRAIITVGIRCIRRPGELADLREDQLRADASGQQAVLHIQFSKVDSAGAGCDVPFERGQSSACPIRCLDTYLRMAKGRPLAGWSPIRGNDFLFVDERGRPFTSAHIKDMVRAVARDAGLSGTFGGHSLRITGACLAAAGGMSLEQIMTIGGWRSRVVQDYLRAQIAVELQASARMRL